MLRTLALLRGIGNYTKTGKNDANQKTNNKRVVKTTKLRWLSKDQFDAGDTVSDIFLFPLLYVT